MLVRSLLIIGMTLFLMGCMKTTEDSSPVNEIDYSKTDYNFKDINLKEVNYE